MKKSKKILILAISGILLILAGASVYLGNTMVDYAIKRSGEGGNRNVSETPKNLSELVTLGVIQKNKIEQKAATKAFMETHSETAAEITSNDGLLLKGFYFENIDSDIWVISIHGYRSNHKSMQLFACGFYERGYNVLLPDLRGCGESEGDYIGMGWTDKNDILLWIKWILQKNPSAKIVIHGVSMGGATTMMVSGENPEGVIGYIEDCGYTSVWDIFASELKLRFDMPKFPIMYTADLSSKIRAGYYFSEASSVKQLKKTEKPVLFIHGTDDDFVPFFMLETVYQAKVKGKKYKLIAEGAGHGDAVYLLGKKYWYAVFKFIDSL